MEAGNEAPCRVPPNVRAISESDIGVESTLDYGGFERGEGEPEAEP